MKAVIMAGGKGTRLYPLTLELPKPMISMFNIPVIEYTIKQLKAAKITQIAMTLQFMPEVIMDYFGNGKRYGVNIDYFIEDKPLGTAGSVKNAKDFLNEDFIVISGDGVCNFNLKEAAKFHYENAADVTMLLYNVNEPLEYGVVVCNDRFEVTNFIEKPPWSKAFSNTVNTGIYICSKNILELIPDRAAFDFSKDLFPAMLDDKKRIMGFEAKGYWCDIGDIGSYLNCHFDILDNKNKIGKEFFTKHSLNQKHDYHNVKIISPCFIAGNVKIESGCVIGPYAVIEDGCVVGENTKIKKSVVKSKSNIGGGCNIIKSIIDSGCIIENNVMCLEGSVIGKNTVLGENVIVMPGVSVFSNKVIPKGQRIKENVVGDFLVLKPDFKDGSITGELKTQLSNENILKIGAIAGTMYENKRIMIGADLSHETMLVKKLVLAEICASGAFAYDINSINEGALSFLTKKLNCELGIYIKFIKSEIIISFYNELGIIVNNNIQRSIEKQFNNFFARAGGQSNITKEDTLIGALQLYIDELKRLFPVKKGSRINISGTGINYIVALEVFKRLGFETTNDQNNKQDMFYLSDSGLEIITKENKIIREETLTLLLALVFFKENNALKFCVPVFAPNDIEDIARKYQGKVERLSSFMNDEFINENHLYSIYLLKDPIRALCSIACFCASNNVCVSSLIKELPQFHYIKKDAKCSKIGRAGLMKCLLREAKKGKYELSDGIKIFHGDGYVLVIPKNYKDEYKMYAQGSSKEYAREICDYYQNKINGFKKDEQ